MIWVPVTVLFFLERLGKGKEKAIEDIRPVDRDLNQAPDIHEALILIIRPRYLAEFEFFISMIMEVTVPWGVTLLQYGRL